MSRLQYPSSYYHSIDFSSSLDKDSAFEICKCHFKKAVGDLGTYPNVNVKLRRRHSDPGPKLAGFLENHLPAECNADGRAPEFQDLTNRYNEDVPTIQHEIEKDETLSNLLQEIRNLRQINRKLSVELFHSKMLLQIAEQTNNYSSEPGSASALVRKLIDAHNAKNDLQPRSLNSRETFGRFGSVSPKTPSETEDKNCLQKEYEGLKNKLRTIENKLKDYPHPQREVPHQFKRRDGNGLGENAASVDRFLPNLVSSSSSTLTSIEDVDSVISLNGLDSEVGRSSWTATSWSRMPAFPSSRLNAAIVDAPDNLNHSFSGPMSAGIPRNGSEVGKSIESTSRDSRCNIKHLKSNHDSLV